MFVKDSSLDNTGQDPLALNNSGDFSQPCSPEEGEDPENDNSDPASEKQKSPIYPHPPVKIFYKVAESRKEILREYKNKCIIYMWFNKITGQVYIGSGINGSTRLANYFSLSVLKRNLRIYRSILKHGHQSFYLIILEVVGQSASVSKAQCLDREQFYLDWAFKTYGLLVLNYLREAGSSLGFKHSEDTKEILAIIATGRKHYEETKRKLSEMFKGELNPFSGKSHKAETIAQMREKKIGKHNPMYNKEKSPEFIAHMTKDRSGINNPQFGKAKSKETIEKLTKKVYVYDATEDYKLLGVYGTVECVKLLKMGKDTLTNKIKTGTLHRGKYFFTREPYVKGS